MTIWKADVGGNFASDQHRRVLATVNNDDITRVQFDTIVARVNKDDQLLLDEEEILHILDDLVADGDIDKTDEGYDSTVVGQEALEGPPADFGGRVYEG